MAVSVNPQFVFILVVPLLTVGVGWVIWLAFNAIGSVVTNIWDKLDL